MSSRTFVPGQLLLRLAPGLELPDVHTHRDVRTGTARASSRLDGGGRLDQVLAKHDATPSITRAFTAARTVTQRGRTHQHYSSLEHELGLSRTFRLEVPRAIELASLIADLAAQHAVEMASRVYLVEAETGSITNATPIDAGEEPWSMVRAKAALEVEPGDSALIVAWVDSGVSPRHRELVGRLRPGLNTVTAAELESSLQLVSGPRPRGQDVTDDQGHGTAVAGILGANGIGIPPGLAGDAELLPIRSLCGAVLSGQTRATALGNLADIDSGLKTAVDLGARVINLSFGTAQSALAPEDPIPHLSVVRYALAHGCILVSAAGNSGVDETYFPAALPGVIAVGAVGADRLRTRFSTGAPYIAVCAPGEGIPVASLDGYARVSGTSFAAPMVAGACALMLARALRQSVALAPETVRELLCQSAAPFAQSDPRTNATTCGAGILDVAAALRAVDQECRTEAA